MDRKALGPIPNKDSSAFPNVLLRHHPRHRLQKLHLLPISQLLARVVSMKALSMRISSGQSHQVLTLISNSTIGTRIQPIPGITRKFRSAQATWSDTIFLTKAPSTGESIPETRPATGILQKSNNSQQRIVVLRHHRHHHPRPVTTREHLACKDRWIL